jgi:hypothetical protein
LRHIDRSGFKVSITFFLNTNVYSDQIIFKKSLALLNKSTIAYIFTFF